MKGKFNMKKFLFLFSALALMLSSCQGNSIPSIDSSSQSDSTLTPSEPSISESTSETPSESVSESTSDSTSEEPAEKSVIPDGVYELELNYTTCGLSEDTSIGTGNLEYSILSDESDKIYDKFQANWGSNVYRQIYNGNIYIVFGNSGVASATFTVPDNVTIARVTIDINGTYENQVLEDGSTTIEPTLSEGTSGILYTYEGFSGKEITISNPSTYYVNIYSIHFTLLVGEWPSATSISVDKGGADEASALAIIYSENLTANVEIGPSIAKQGFTAVASDSSLVDIAINGMKVTISPKNNANSEAFSITYTSSEVASVSVIKWYKIVANSKTEAALPSGTYTVTLNYQAASPYLPTNNSADPITIDMEIKADDAQHSYPSLEFLFSTGAHQSITYKEYHLAANGTLTITAPENATISKMSIDWWKYDNGAITYGSGSEGSGFTKTNGTSSSNSGSLMKNYTFTGEASNIVKIRNTYSGRCSIFSVSVTLTVA